MKSYFFKNALLPNGWQKNVRVECNHGVFTQVVANSQAHADDIQQNCVIASMPNAHSHVFQRCMAGLTEFKTAKHDSFWSWRELMYRYANSISPEQLYHIARFTYAEMLDAGYSSVCEFHYVHRNLADTKDISSLSKAVLKAANDVGIALTFLPVLYTQADMQGSELSPLQKRFELSVDEYIELYAELKKALFPKQNLGICFHSLRAVSIPQMQSLLAELNEPQPIHIHIAEQTAEVQQCLEVHGKRPVELLFENFEVNANWSLIHATHLTPNEVKLIANSKAVAGICPLTEANLGDGVFPLPQFMQQNGVFSIGSDSHIGINPFLELQTFEYSQRLALQQRIIASTETTENVGDYLWNQAVKGGSQSSQLNTHDIAENQQANWIELDSEHVLATCLSPSATLNATIFVDSRIMKKHFVAANATPALSEEILENYKNTLKTLR